jgi:hypothetical protein
MLNLAGGGKTTVNHGAARDFSATMMLIIAPTHIKP